jgi:hypothetical protein
MRLGTVAAMAAHNNTCWSNRHSLGVRAAPTTSKATSSTRKGDFEGKSGLEKQLQHDASAQMAVVRAGRDGGAGVNVARAGTRQ